MNVFASMFLILGFFIIGIYFDYEKIWDIAKIYYLAIILAIFINKNMVLYLIPGLAIYPGYVFSLSIDVVCGYLAILFNMMILIGILRTYIKSHIVGLIVTLLIYEFNVFASTTFSSLPHFSVAAIPAFYLGLMIGEIFKGKYMLFNVEFVFSVFAFSQVIYVVVNKLTIEYVHIPQTHNYFAILISIAIAIAISLVLVYNFDRGEEDDKRRVSKNN